MAWLISVRVDVISFYRMGVWGGGVGWKCEVVEGVGVGEIFTRGNGRKFVAEARRARRRANERVVRMLTHGGSGDVSEAARGRGIQSARR